MFRCIRGSRVEDVFDWQSEEVRNLEGEQESWVVLVGLDGGDGLSGDAESLGQHGLGPLAIGTQHERRTGPGQTVPWLTTSAFSPTCLRRRACRSHAMDRAARGSWTPVRRVCRAESVSGCRSSGPRHVGCQEEQRQRSTGTSARPRESWRDSDWCQADLWIRFAHSGSLNAARIVIFA